MTISPASCFRIPVTSLNPRFSPVYHVVLPCFHILPRFHHVFPGGKPPRRDEGGSAALPGAADGAALQSHRQAREDGGGHGGTAVSHFFHGFVMYI